MDKTAENVYGFSRNGNNAYFIDGAEKVLIDGVEEKYSAEYIEELSELTDIFEIKYIVINHSEYNRSGTLRAVLEKNPTITVIASTAGLKFLHEMLDIEFDDMPAKNMGTLKIGDTKTLTFILAPYVNWPDSMMTLYEADGERLLFSCDLFSGADEITLSETEKNCKNPNMPARERYFLKYLSYYPEFFKAARDKVTALGNVRIYPGTGECTNINDVNVVSDKSDAEQDLSAVIVYSSKHGTTRKMAELVKMELERLKIGTKIYNAEGYGAEYIADEIDNANCIFIGTDTLNADMPRELWRVLTGLKKTLNKRKPCMIFGSYGWSGEGLSYAERYMKLIGASVPEKPFGVCFKMRAEDADALRLAVDKFIRRALKKE